MASDSRVPARRVDTHLSCAKQWQPQQSQPSKGLLGVTTSRGRPDIAEVSLEKGRTSRTYRRRLESALADVLFWVSVSAFAATAWLADPLLANQVLCEWVQHVYESGGKISLARHGILSIQTCRRELKGKLGRAWDALKSWQLRTPLKSRVPMPELLMSLFHLLAGGGYVRSEGS